MGYKRMQADDLYKFFRRWQAGHSILSISQALGIDREQYGADLCGDRIYLLDAPRSRARRTPRIGVDYAGAWALKPWRFFEPENRYVSPVRDLRGARG